MAPTVWKRVTLPVGRYTKAALDLAWTKNSGEE